ncbi:rhodanese-like domain-containing protein [Geomicrobium sp. JCM 19055]|uniref:rhodanese-like domain-containing protein n=1 Tax=Geomicrobium sp. JCM 19055 TaxID=1460649 RepID=UPI00045ECC92|nr:rhodanese-like domain-containing protein [Geomicrobium sp. JCM 19055]GAJ97257.1 rhodanese-like domain protein [Geomicrobium sp. JCM 19055]
MSIAVILIFAIVIMYLIKQMSPGNIRQITTEELKAKLRDKDLRLVDVRTEGEFSNHSIRGAINIPLHTLSNRMDELERDKEIAVICQSGMRSLKASKQLKKNEFTNVVNVRGGMNSWN